MFTDSGVKVYVDAEPGQLVTGNVPFVKVQGRGWASPAGKLTCRRIEASVSDCKLDFRSVITRQKLVLNKPGKDADVFVLRVLGMNVVDFAENIFICLL